MKKNILLTSLIIGLVLFCPNWQGSYPKAAAQFGDLGEIVTGGFSGEKVQIVSDSSETAITTAIKATLSELSNAMTAEGIDWLRYKETVLDPLVWSMSKNLQQQLTSELLKWLGGQQEGQDGQVPFVQNYSEYYQDILDSIETDYINQAFSYDTGACSEEEVEKNFLIRKELIESYAKARQGGNVFQCVGEEDDEGLGILNKMAKKIFSCDTPICGQYKAKEELALKQLQAIENEKQLLDYTQGMEPARVCQTVRGSDGTTRNVCQLVNPPYLAAEATSFMLTQFPALQLLNMDEFDEAATDLMSNLTNQVLQGVSGVLGLSGNPNYFSAEGGLSYAEQLAQSDVSAGQTGAAVNITEALNIEFDYYSLVKNGILDVIAYVEGKLDNNKNEYPDFDLELSDSQQRINEQFPAANLTENLQEIKDKYTTILENSSSTIAILTRMAEVYYDENTSDNDRNQIRSDFNQMRGQGVIHTEYDLKNLETSYIGLEFARHIEFFHCVIDKELRSVGGGKDPDCKQ